MTIDKESKHDYNKGINSKEGIFMLIRHYQSIKLI